MSTPSLALGASQPSPMATPARCIAMCSPSRPRPGRGGGRPTGRYAIEVPDRADQLDLLVVEPHGVGQQQVRAEHAEVVEVDERAHAGAGEVGGGVVARRRDVHRHVRAAGAGEVGGAGEQGVGGEVVADERDPALDEAAGRQEVEASPPGGRASRRSGRRTARARCPSPRRRARRGCPTVRAASAAGCEVSDRAGLDHRGHAVEEAVDERQRRREPVVVGRVGVVQGHGPGEDRLARRQVVGHAAAGQRIAGRVLVGVDEAGRDDATGGVELGARRDGRRARRRSVPTATIVPPAMAMAPSRMMRRSASIVSRSPPVTSRSAGPASLNRGPARRRTRGCCRRDR